MYERKPEPTELSSGTYLIHLDSPYPNGTHPRHYLGYSRSIPRRFEMHKAGEGSKLLRACNERGIGYEISRIWQGATPLFESFCKTMKKSYSLICPHCTEVSSMYDLKFVQDVSDVLVTKYGINVEDAIVVTYIDFTGRKRTAEETAKSIYTILQAGETKRRSYKR